MPVIECALLSEGSSDQVLIPMLEWLLREHAPQNPSRVEWVDLLRCPRKPATMIDKITAALELHHCHILFVHRDSDGKDPERRYSEIRDAIASLPHGSRSFPYVCVVPIRMTEAWLLTEEAAIRTAAGNPNGAVPLVLPPLQRLETILDPKEQLRELLRTASGMSGRRLKRFNDSLSLCARRVAGCMHDLQRLRELSSFQRLESDLSATLRQLGLLGSC
jgi:hypothetical protein